MAKRKKKKADFPLGAHPTRPWQPDLKGHQQGGKRIARSKSVIQELIKRTEALIKEIMCKGG